MEVTVTRIRGIEAVTGKLSHLPHIVERATVSGLNKISAQAFTAASRAMREEYAIKQADLAKSKALVRVSAKRETTASGPRLFAMIIARMQSIPLYKFSPSKAKSQKGIPVKKRRPVTVKVKRKEGRKPVQGGFIATMKSGHTGIFKRGGKESLPIHELFTASAGAMFKKFGIEAARKIAVAKGAAIIRHELDFFLRKEGLKK
jgi:hypothetical protein